MCSLPPPHTGPARMPTRPRLKRRETAIGTLLPFQVPISLLCQIFVTKNELPHCLIEMSTSRKVILRRHPPRALCTPAGLRWICAVARGHITVFSDRGGSAVPLPNLNVISCEIIRLLHAQHEKIQTLPCTVRRGSRFVGHVRVCIRAHPDSTAPFAAGPLNRMIEFSLAKVNGFY